MTDQTDVREFLDRMANETGFAPVEPGPVVRKARRRLARTVGGTLLTAGALVAGAFVAANGLMNAARTQMPEPGGQLTPTTTENGQPVGQPSPPFTERFDSPLHGFSMGYPSGWRTRAATEPWGHGELAFDAPDVDVIFHPTLRDDLYLAVASEPLGGKSRQRWYQGADLLPYWGNCEGGSDYMLDDAWGLIGYSCENRVGGGYVRGRPSAVLVVPTGSRGYIIHLHVGDERRLHATYDEDWFRAALETVDLRPEDALDALNPSVSP